MKRFVTGSVVALLFILAPIAEARISICLTAYGDNGEVCYEDCSYYDSRGNRTGRVIVDYHC